MRKRSMTALVASLLLLTACTAPAEKSEGQVPAADAEATDFQERADPAPESPNLLPDLDVSGLEETMPETDFAAFRAYLPVLTGEESFRWVAGPYDGYPDGDWEPFDAFMAAVHDRYWSDSEAENPPETLTLDRLAVADIVGGEEPELVLLLQDRGYNYLVFHRESGEVCGTSFSVRWLMDLQKSGIYMGSGGADVSYYYQLSFHDGRFWGEALGEKVVDRCQLNGMEVSEADFNTWYEENMTNDVTWYASDGAVIPENM